MGGPEAAPSSSYTPPSWPGIAQDVGLKDNMTFKRVYGPYTILGFLTGYAKWPQVYGPGGP